MSDFLKVCNELGEVCKKLTLDPYNDELEILREHLLKLREEIINDQSG